MPMKGALAADHIAKNKYSLRVPGLPDLTVVSLGTIEEEILTIELPDKTKASGGDSNPGEMTFTLPMHHTLEELAIELWYLEAKGPVAPSYKRPAVVSYQSISETSDRSYTLEGCWISKRVLPEAEMGDDGDLQVTEWTMSYDNVLPLG